MSSRNEYVDKAVQAAIDRIDRFLGGEPLNKVPSKEVRAVADAQLGMPPSTRLATLFFAFYALEDLDWDCDTLPTGLRGKWGDKRLANELSVRQLTLHNAITAFGENLGWKGNVTAVRLSNHQRFSELSAAMKNFDVGQKSSMADYMAARFAESQAIIAPLPPVGAGVLTFARARLLLYRLISEPSEGNIQQFLVAGILKVHRARFGIDVRTHHVHASDKFDATAGDIEELRDGELIRAYEVTVRPDWKNRLSDFRAKMDGSGLTKYTIIASDVSSDEDLAAPAQMLKFLEPYGRDIAVIDIYDFMNVFAAELSSKELREAVNASYQLLVEPKLCGRPDILTKYRVIVSEWLDAAA
jgi:hypothetical protein